MAYLIPKAKRNIHQCEHHLRLMEQSHNIEELEINFAAFVISARSVTFVLQKEFSDNKKFLKWYGDRDKPTKETKRYEMREDLLCKYFLGLRNSIEKEGISGLKGISTEIQSFDSSKDIINKPEGMDGLVIGPNGIFIRVFPDTPKADLIPAVTNVGIITLVGLENAPKMHLGKSIDGKNLFEMSRMYYEYLKKLVEEWTDMVNNNTVMGHFGPRPRC